MMLHEGVPLHDIVLLRNALHETVQVTRKVAKESPFEERLMFLPPLEAVDRNALQARLEVTGGAADGRGTPTGGVSKPLLKKLSDALPGIPAFHVVPVRDLVVSHHTLVTLDDPGLPRSVGFTSKAG